METKIKRSPRGGNLLKYRLKITVLIYVARLKDSGVHLPRQRFHKRLRLFVEISQREIRTSAVKLLRSRPGKTVVVGKTNNKPFFP